MSCTLRLGALFVGPGRIEEGRVGRKRDQDTAELSIPSAPMMRKEQLIAPHPRYAVAKRGNCIA